MNLQVIQFQYGLEFFRLSYSKYLYNPSKMSSGGIFVIDKKFRPYRIEFVNIVISINNSEQVGVVFDRIMDSNDPEVIVDQVSNLSATKETVLLLGLFVPPD